MTKPQEEKGEFIDNKKLKRNKEDSDEEDEDYIPTKESDDEEDNNDSRMKSSDDDGMKHYLSINKQRNVDEAFASLFGASDTNYFEETSITHNKSVYLKQTTSTSKMRKLHKKNKKKLAAKKKCMKKKKKFLTELFGKDQAFKILSRVSKKNPTNHHSRPLIKMEKKTIIEVKKFAGKSIEVKKVVMVPTATNDAKIKDSVNKTTPSITSSKSETSSTVNTKPPTPSKNTPTGIDHVLSQIANPDKLSTIAKSSADWDFFKDRSGLEEELEKQAQGKNAYLVKQEFLQRVDLRKFEQEKEGRDQKRAASSK